MSLSSKTRAHPRIAATGAGALSIALVAGCAVDGATGEPTARTSEPLLGICQPLTCCFPSGGGWTENAFEDSLRALGCAVPQAYTESLGKSDWWLYSTCPPSVDLTTLVLQYALVSPYYAKPVVNECLELHGVGDGQPTSVFVEWDPTCSSCYYSSYTSNTIYPYFYSPSSAAAQPEQ